jgi:recyclin-1
LIDLGFLLIYFLGGKVQSIASDFSHLKMLGHVYVVEDAKDLAQIVRDVTRYGGAYRPEVSLLFVFFWKRWLMV